MNKKIQSAVLAASLAIIFFDLRAAAQGEIPFRVKKVTDRVTIFSPGRYAPRAATTVITTAKGLIVIDTGLSPTLAELTRKKIKQELGRDDVIYVINTHDHFDHTDGNQVYVGAIIVGHENVGAAMRRFAEGRSGFIATRRNRIVQLENRLKTLQPGSPDALEAEETIRFDRLMIEDLEKRYIPTPPTKTFNDRMTLAVGDLELKLYSYGRAHTESDILIHIPRLGVLFVGDLFFPTSLLAAANAAGPPDVPRWLEVLGEVLKNKDEVKTVVGGHGHSFAPEWLAAQHRYFRQLWSTVSTAKNEGLTPETAEARNPLGQNFAFLGPFFDLKSKEVLDSHRQNIQLFWRSGMKPASEEIDRIIHQSGLKAGRARFKELRTQLAREFFVDERAFNALGYQFLRERKIPEAVAVFEMNAETFPESWNVWDSLAEGDLWVCFKKTDGSWTEAFNLGDMINTPGTNFCPSLSPDVKFLFYATSRDIYWISAEAITRLRPKDLK
jgi:cyclase